MDHYDPTEFIDATGLDPADYGLEGSHPPVATIAVPMMTEEEAAQRVAIMESIEEQINAVGSQSEATHPNTVGSELPVQEHEQPAPEPVPSGGSGKGKRAERVDDSNPTASVVQNQTEPPATAEPADNPSPAPGPAAADTVKSSNDAAGVDASGNDKAHLIKPINEVFVARSGVDFASIIAANSKGKVRDLVQVAAIYKSCGDRLVRVLKFAARSAEQPAGARVETTADAVKHLQSELGCLEKAYIADEVRRASQKPQRFVIQEIRDNQHTVEGRVVDRPADIPSSVSQMSATKDKKTAAQALPAPSVNVSAPRPEVGVRPGTQAAKRAMQTAAVTSSPSTIAGSSTSGVAPSGVSLRQRMASGASGVANGGAASTRRAVLTREMLDSGAREVKGSTTSSGTGQGKKRSASAMMSPPGTGAASRTESTTKTRARKTSGPVAKKAKTSSSGSSKQQQPSAGSKTEIIDLTLSPDQGQDDSSENASPAMQPASTSGHRRVVVAARSGQSLGSVQPDEPVGRPPVRDAGKGYVTIVKKTQRKFILRIKIDPAYLRLASARVAYGMLQAEFDRVKLQKERHNADKRARGLEGARSANAPPPPPAAGLMAPPPVPKTSATTTTTNRTPAVATATSATKQASTDNSTTARIPGVPAGWESIHRVNTEPRRASNAGNRSIVSYISPGPRTTPAHHRPAFAGASGVRRASSSSASSTPASAPSSAGPTTPLHAAPAAGPDPASSRESSASRSVVVATPSRPAPRSRTTTPRAATPRSAAARSAAGPVKYERSNTNPSKPFRASGPQKGAPPREKSSRQSAKAASAGIKRVSLALGGDDEDEEEEYEEEDENGGEEDGGDDDFAADDW